MTALSPRRTFSGTALKTIACITMLVDHIGASCIEAGILTPGLDAGTLSQDALSAYPLYRLDMVLRFTGRLAFPARRGFRQPDPVQKAAHSGRRVDDPAL